MKSKIITHRAWLRVLSALALVMASCHTLWAQNVVISPTTGKFVAAKTLGSEVGFERGWSSLWRHDQLQLSLSVSDDKGLDAGGEFTNPAGNLLRKDDTSFYIAGGKSKNSQIILSLPKGYRITSYEIVLLNENNGKTISELNCGRISKSFRETDSGFSQTKAYAKSANGNYQMSRDNENTEYVIKRTSTGKGDMGDHLYFQIERGGDAFYALTVKSFEIHFAADNDFTTRVTPTSASNGAVSVSTSSFNVGIADLGPIQPQTKSGKTYYAYSYENVNPLKAAFTLFQEDAVNDGVAKEGVATQKKISTVRIQRNPAKFVYSLKSGVYYIESPTSMVSQNNIQLPIGYRITGAKLICRKSANNSSNYTVRLYNADGKTYNDLTVTSTTEQKIEVGNLNNDAVKFEVIGSDAAYVTFDITMQALSPYVKNMDINCHDNAGNTITNTFTVSNFFVSGGKFVFYVPEESNGIWRFTFDNLRSDYADNTYYDNSGIGKSRYSFVNSPYWETAASLYNSDPNHTYLDKIHVETAGNRAFRFNNADELDNNSQSTETRYWTEYPFSIQNYLAQDSQNKFDAVYVEENETGEAYIFTADETRYNIAPTTATEHRYYAYYKMEVEVKKKTYQPIVEIKKIYDRTCYEGDVEFAQYGAKVTTEKLADGTMGYLTATQIKEAVTNELQKLGAKPEHLLYVDASALHSVYQPNALNALQKAIGKNALIYLPRFTTYNGNNCATKTLAGSFISCGNIIFTDKHPFYAPYDIDVNAANYASYERKITVVNSVEYGKSVNATIMLPFTLKLDEDGVHYNRDYNGNLINDVKFSVKTLQSEKCMEYTDSPYGNRIDYAENYAHFVPFTGEMTEPNAPYMVHVKEAPDDPTCLFSAIQYGAEIKATEGMNATDYTYSGDVATGTLDVECTFTPLASYAGNKLDKTGNYFYFAKNWFLCSQNILSSNYLYVHPFRAFFEYTGTTKARRFGIIFGENTGGSTAIETAAQTTTPNGLSVSTLNGGLEISASVTTVVRINNVCGEAVANVAIKGGETKSVHLPSGIYVVEGKKVVVK